MIPLHLPPCARRFACRAVVLLAGAATSLAATAASPAVSDDTVDGVLRTYAEVARHAYGAAWDDAVALGRAVDLLTRQPDDNVLERARAAWLTARRSYGRTEAFRFSGGPIDIVDAGTDSRSFELRLNAWPLDEARIDSVHGRPENGLINDLDSPISRELLIKRNMRDSESEVTIGYHAIEFLLWGQDLRSDGPGNRPAADYDPDTETGRRRGKYLRIVTFLLIDDLRTLVAQWSGKSGSYAERLVARSPADALSAIFGGLERFTAFELAMERLAVPLDSGDQEDEQSCFSDSTSADFVADVRGIADVYHGNYDEFRGTGLDTWLAAQDAELAAAVAERLATVAKSARALHAPFDRILVAPAGSPPRAGAERLVDELMALSDLWSLARLRAESLR